MSWPVRSEGDGELVGGVVERATTTCTTTVDERRSPSAALRCARRSASSRRHERRARTGSTMTIVHARHSAARDAPAPDDSACVRALAAAACAGSPAALAAHAAGPAARCCASPASDIDTLDPHQLQDKYSRDVASRDLRGPVRVGLPRPPARAGAAHRRGAADDLGRRQDVDDPGQAGHPLHRRSRRSGGKPRELVAEDYVYSIKRSLDPNLRGGGDPLITRPHRRHARSWSTPRASPARKFDYDAPVEGLRALDRYTLQLKLTERQLSARRRDAPAACGGRARGGRGGAAATSRRAPVGTGPYRAEGVAARLARRARGQSRLPRAVVSRRAATPRSRALVRAMKGKKLPADRPHRDRRSSTSSRCACSSSTAASSTSSSCAARRSAGS